MMNTQRAALEDGLKNAALMRRESTEADRMPLSEKYALTIKEAAIYFNIGNKKLRRLAENNLGRFALESGNRFLIIRPKFEQFLSQSTAIGVAGVWQIVGDFRGLQSDRDDTAEGRVLTEKEAPG